mgnify:CR=1 FL=1
MDDDNLNTLLDSLSSFNFDTVENKQQVEQTKSNSTLSEGEINDYFLSKTKALIDAGIGAVQDMTPYIVQGQNPDEIDALASLMTATTKALENLNKGSLIDKKAEKDEKLKRIEIEARKELAQLQPKNQITNNTNVLVASREEIMKKLIDTKETEVLKIHNK